MYSIENDLRKYNPLDPKEDYKNIYNWGCVINSYPAVQREYELTHKPSDGWTVASVAQRPGANSPVVWYKQLKCYLNDTRTISTQTNNDTISNEDGDGAGDAGIGAGEPV